MKKQALELMNQREVMIAEAIEVLNILGADMNVKTVEKIVEVPVEKEVVVTDTKEIERLNQIIAERDELISKLQDQIKVLEARQSIKVEEPSKEETTEEVEPVSTTEGLEIHAEDEHTIHGYYLRPEGNSIKKTPFTCGKKTCSPIVYGKDMMQYSEKIGQMLLEKGLVSNHKVKIDLHTMTINVRGKDVEMMVYKDKTGALVGAVEQRCAFTKHPSCKFPLVTQMKAFIDNGVHQIENEDGTKTPIKGYASDKTHDSYKFAIAQALAKFEEQEAKEVAELIAKSEEFNAEEMFNQQFNTPVVEVKEQVDKDIEEQEAEYFAQMNAMFGTNY